MTTEENKVSTESSNVGVEENMKERKARALRSFLVRLIVFVAILYLMFWHLVGIAIMPNNDMRPRIDAGDLLLFYRVEREWKPQDVVVFEKDAGEGTKTFVCRVVARPGDTVEISDDYGLKVNGNVIVETDIFAATRPYDSSVTYPLKLGDGEYFVLSDYRNGGVDSRFFGVVVEDEIKGVVITLMRRNRI